MTREAIYQAVKKYGLPDLPDEGPGDRDLVLFTMDDDPLVIAWNVTESDARVYCQREDTHGDGWFVGYQRS